MRDRGSNFRMELWTFLQMKNQAFRLSFEKKFMKKFVKETWNLDEESQKGSNLFEYFFNV